MTPSISIDVGGDYTGQLKRRLEQYGISLNELSRESEIDRAQIAKWMNTKRQPHLKNIAKIEQAIARILARRASESPYK